MKRDDFADIDTKTASGARVYDYLLGGTDNYAIDRAAADQVEGILPGTKAMARNSRRFLERVVRYLAQDCGMVRGMMDRVPPGSYLAISHVVSDEARVRQQMTEVSLANTRGNFGRIRSREDVRAFFDGLEPVEPGLVDIRDWRPDGPGEEQADRWFVFGGVARKPA